MADGQCTPLHITHEYNIATSNILQILQEVSDPERSSFFPMASICVTYMQQDADYHHCHTVVAQPLWHCC